MEKVNNRYCSLIAHIFQKKFSSGDIYVEFSRQEIEDAAIELNIELPKNLGDII